jgi:hypothetical protein
VQGYFFAWCEITDFAAVQQIGGANSAQCEFTGTGSQSFGAVNLMDPQCEWRIGSFVFPQSTSFSFGNGNGA